MENLEWINYFSLWKLVKFNWEFIIFLKLRYTFQSCEKKCIFYVSGIAWLIIPQKWIINLGNGDIEINSWRVFLAICSLPEFLACIAIFAFPESPRFLLLKGKTDEALEVFKKIYSVNTGKDPSTYPVSNFGNVISDISYIFRDSFESFEFFRIFFLLRFVLSWNNYIMI